jgi:hypothetical protein
MGDASSGDLTGLVISCIVTALQNTLFKQRKREIHLMGRRGKRRKQLLDDLKETKG